MLLKQHTILFLFDWLNTNHSQGYADKHIYTQLYSNLFQRRYITL